MRRSHTPHMEDRNEPYCAFLPFGKAIIRLSQIRRFIDIGIVWQEQWDGSWLFDLRDVPQN